MPTIPSDPQQRLLYFLEVGAAMMDATISGRTVQILESGNAEWEPELFWVRWFGLGNDRSSSRRLGYFRWMAQGGVDWAIPASKLDHSKSLLLNESRGLASEVAPIWRDIAEGASAKAWNRVSAAYNAIDPTVVDPADIPEVDDLVDWGFGSTVWFTNATVLNDVYDWVDGIGNNIVGTLPPPNDDASG